MQLTDVTAKKLQTFRQWLHNHGCELLPPTNDYEKLRFRHNNGTGVIYTNAAGSRFSCNDKAVAEAWQAFTSARPWNQTERRTKGRSKALDELIRRDGVCCWYCETPLNPEQMTREHLLSQAHGGPNRIENLVIACQPCNVAVGNMPLPDKIKHREAVHAANRAAREAQP